MQQRRHQHTARGHVADVAPEAFASVQVVNLIGLFACCHAALPHMIAAGYGRIVNVSSGAAIMCNPGESAYAASKAAVNALTIAMAKEVRASNVLVNAMSPRLGQDRHEPDLGRASVRGRADGRLVGLAARWRPNRTLLPVHAGAADAARHRPGLEEPLTRRSLSV